MRIAQRARQWVRTGRVALIATACLLLSARQTMHAQTGPAHASVVVQSAVDRARAMAENGNGVGARRVLDSLVIAVATAADDLAEALYWRAVFSERAADAELDWKRLIIEAPLSPRTPDALLRLAEAELVRGDASGARRHLEHLVRDFSDVPQRPKAVILIVRSYFDERDVSRACRTITALRAADVPPGELQLQADELRTRCARAQQAALDAAKASDTLNPPVRSTSVASPLPAAPSTALPAAPKPLDTAARATPKATPLASEPVAPTSRDAVRTTGEVEYSVQIAAYDTRAKGAALVKRLTMRGIKARVDGDRKPFRVRVGRYATRAEATAVLAKMKKQGQSGFVTESKK